MTNLEHADVIEACATKVGAFSTEGVEGAFEQRLFAQRVLIQASAFLRERAALVRVGEAPGVYDDPNALTAGHGQRT